MGLVKLGYVGHIEGIPVGTRWSQLDLDGPINFHIINDNVVHNRGPENEVILSLVRTKKKRI